MNNFFYKISVLLALFFQVIRADGQVRSIEISHYLFPEFTRGVVMVKNGTTYEAMLNYNSLTEEMVFDSNGKILALDDHVVAHTDTITIEGRKFITLDGKFIELLHSNKYVLYAEHRCRVNAPGRPAGYGSTTHTAATTSYSTYQADGRLYALKLPDGYEPIPYTYYWIERNGELSRATTLRQLERLFHDKRNAYRSYVRKHNVAFRNHENITGLIQHLESN